MLNSSASAETHLLIMEEEADIDGADHKGAVGEGLGKVKDAADLNPLLGLNNILVATQTADLTIQQVGVNLDTAHGRELHSQQGTSTARHDARKSVMAHMLTLLGAVELLLKQRPAYLQRLIEMDAEVVERSLKDCPVARHLLLQRKG
jgi:hypothetical protein